MNVTKLTEPARTLHLLKPCGADPNEMASLKFLLVYEDSETGARAKQIMNRLADYKESGGESKPVMFRFEVLRMKEIWELAAKECQTVDVLIISASDAGTVPVEVKSWVTYWLGLKGGQPRMVIASFDKVSFQTKDAEMTVFFLRSLAEWADVDLKILFGNEPQAELSPGLHLIAHPTNRNDLPLTEIAARIHASRAGRHWGLNE